MVKDELISHLAKLANLSLSDEEYNIYKNQFKSIIKFIDSLENINTETLVPVSNVTGAENVTRKDVIKEGNILTNNQALSNTKISNNGYFEVPLILSRKTL